MKANKVCDAPMAVTSDGDIVVNMSHSNGPADAGSLLDRALKSGAPVFVGTLVTAKELPFVRKWIDDTSAELAGTVFGDRSGGSAGRTRP